MTIHKYEALSLSYDDWNEKLFYYFFGDHSKGKIVYLNVTEDVIKDIGANSSLNKEESLASFYKAVRGYEYSNIDNIFSKAWLWGDRWFKQNKEGIPPFIGVLASTVLAASKMDQSEGVHSNNYYYRLREILGDLESLNAGSIKDFDKTRGLWKYLERWLLNKEGQHGYLNVFRFGYRNIGYPRSQCLIREADRKELYDFFLWADYLPVSKGVNEQEITDRLSIYLQNKNSRLARYFVESQSRKGLLDAFVKMVILELKNWDGTSVDDTFKLTSNRKFRRELLLNLKFQEVNGEPVPYFSLVRYVNDESDIDSYIPLEVTNGYIKQSLNDISVLDQDCTFDVGQDSNVRLFHEAKDLYIFEKGIHMNLKGWTQVSDLRLNQRYLFLLKEEKLDAVNEWLKINSLKKEGFQLENYISSKWSLLHVTIGEGSLKRTDLLDSNLFVDNRSVDLVFQGGLKTLNKEWLFDALPTITIYGKYGDVLRIDSVETLCLLQPKVSYDMKDLYLPEPKGYKISVGNYHEQIFLKNQNNNYINFENFIPEKHDLNVKEIKIAGSYIYDNEEFIANLPLPFVQLGEGKAEVAYSGNKSNVMKFNTKMNSPALAKDKESLGLSFYEFDKSILRRPIELLLEYLTIKREGTWRDFIEAVQYIYEDEIGKGGNKSLIAYEIRRNLAKLGMIEFIKEPFATKFNWKVNPSSIAVLPSSDTIMNFTGGRTRHSLLQVKEELPNNLRMVYVKPNTKYEPLSFYLIAKDDSSAREYLRNTGIPYNWGEDYFAYHLLRILPTLNELVYSVAPIDLTSIPEGEKTEYWDSVWHKWSMNQGLLKRVHFNQFNKTTYIMDKSVYEGRPVDKEIGKLFSAQRSHSTVFIYRPYELLVRKEYHLPDLYERCITSCSGTPPMVASNPNFRKYINVPLEIALSLSVKLGFKLHYK